ncbi:MAG: hypothetical protein ACR2PI_18665 [Hyphomicrobiaceae bacterium]
MAYLTELGLASFVAAALISFFAVMRLATRSSSSPGWLTGTLTAYAFAVPFTIAIAASFGYLGYALQPFMNIALATVASMGMHLAMLAFFRMLLPVKDQAPAGEPARRAPQQAATAAA